MNNKSPGKCCPSVWNLKVTDCLRLVNGSDIVTARCCVCGSIWERRYYPSGKKQTWQLVKAGHVKTV